MYTASVCILVQHIYALYNIRDGGESQVSYMPIIQHCARNMVPPDIDPWQAIPFDSIKKKLPLAHTKTTSASADQTCNTFSDT